MRSGHPQPLPLALCIYVSPHTAHHLPIRAPTSWRRHWGFSQGCWHHSPVHPIASVSKMLPRSIAGCGLLGPPPSSPVLPGGFDKPPAGEAPWPGFGNSSHFGLSHKAPPARPPLCPGELSVRGPGMEGGVWSRALKGQRAGQAGSLAPEPSGTVAENMGGGREKPRPRSLFP